MSGETHESARITGRSANETEMRATALNFAHGLRGGQSSTVRQLLQDASAIEKFLKSGEVPGS